MTGRVVIVDGAVPARRWMGCGTCAWYSLVGSLALIGLCVLLAAIGGG